MQWHHTKILSTLPWWQWHFQRWQHCRSTKYVPGCQTTDHEDMMLCNAQREREREREGKTDRQTTKRLTDRQTESKRLCRRDLLHQGYRRLQHVSKLGRSLVKGYEWECTWAAAVLGIGQRNFKTRPWQIQNHVTLCSSSAWSQSSWLT